MECPNCHSKGNVLRKVFGIVDRKKGIKYCMHCGVKIHIKYRWGRIFLLLLVIIILVLAIHYILIYVFKMPGLTPVLAGSITALLLLFLMQNKTFVKIEILKIKEKLKKN